MTHIYIILIALLVAGLFKILIYAMWRHIVDIKRCQITKNGISLSIEMTLCAVVTLIAKFLDMSNVAFPWKQNRLQALFMRKVKSEFSSFNKCYLLLLFIQWVWATIDITWHKHKKVRYALEQHIRHFSLCKGRGLVTRMLLWWHHNPYHNVWFL